MRRRFVALAAVLGVLAGCSGPAHHSSAPTTTASQTAASPNPDVIPPVITPAYVNAVFAVLNHVYGNATRTLVASRKVTPDVQADLKSIFSPGLYEQQLAQAESSLQGPIDNVRPNPSDGMTTVRNLVAASPRCIFAETATNLDDVLVRPVPAAASEYYQLTPKAVGLDPGHLNATPWMISFNAAFLTPTSIGNRCAS